MGSQLPQHLQDILTPIPKGHRYNKLIYLRKKGLFLEIRKRTAQRRRYQFQLHESQDVIDVKTYPARNKPGYYVLTGILKEGEGRVIIGRDPAHGRRYFKVFRGYLSGFDDKYLIEKVLAEPGQSQEACQDGEHYTSAGGKQQVNQTSSSPDQAEGEAKTSSKIQLSEGSRSTRARPTRHALDPEYVFDNSDDYNSLSSERSSRSISPPDARKRVSSVELGSEDVFRKALKSRSTRTTEPVLKIEDDDDVKMLDPAPVAQLRTASLAATAGHPATTPSPLHNLRVYFQPAEANLVIPTRRWFVCNTLKKLFSQALVAQIINRDESMSGLLVKVKSAADSPIKAFAIAEGDVDTFDNLHFELNQAVRDWGLKGTTVEVSRI